MNKPEDTPQTSISKARSLEEIADFWDTHSLDDDWDQTREAMFEVRTQIDNSRSTDMIDLKRDGLI